MRKLLCVSAVMGLALLVGSATVAEEKANSKTAEALKARAEEFTKAFDKGDAKALAEFWAEDGDYVDQAGHTLKGRKAIEAAFAKQFEAEKGGKLHINTTSLRVVNDDLAIEDGTTEVTYPDDTPPAAARYTAVHAKKGGQWYLVSVRDAAYVPPSNHDQLSDLDWLEGDWLDEAQKGETARASYVWAENDNFLVGTFEMTLKDVPVAGGTQWIGWDGAAKHIRSWSFSSNGGFSEATWSRDGNKWTLKSAATMRDGKKLTGTNVITKVDADHFTFQSMKRTLDGKELPDAEVVKMKRAK